MLKNLVGSIMVARLAGRNITKITFDRPTFEEVKKEWNEQNMYRVHPEFLFGLEIVVVDEMLIE